MVLHTQRHMQHQYERDFSSSAAYVVLRCGTPVANVVFKAKGPNKTRTVYVDIIPEEKTPNILVKGVSLASPIRFAAVAEKPQRSETHKQAIETDALAVLFDQMNMHYKATPNSTPSLATYKANFSKLYRVLTDSMSHVKPPHESSWIGACHSHGFTVIVVI